MTKEQIAAVRAMMYAYDKYGAEWLSDTSYLINPFMPNGVVISFGEAYNICQEMIDVESEKQE